MARPKGIPAWNKLPPEEARRRDLERKRNYYQRNKEAHAERSRAWALKNSEKVKADHARYYQENKEVLSQKNKEYQKKNWDWLLPKKNELKNKSRANNPEYRLILNMRERIRFAVKTAKGFKKQRTRELLGCSAQFLIGYLEAKFEIGMSWENYGEWHIDHIIPCAAFDLKNLQAQEECFHYTNLQPLWKEDNLKKLDRLPDGSFGRNNKLEVI